MNVRQIIAPIYYVGVNDRTTFKFENLWPLPYGVSYNSYLVKGSEKIALIDTVEISSMKRFVDGIKDLLGERMIDYLVVNHMEPDHSAGIPGMVEMFKDLKIIGNRQTIAMIKGYYGINDDRFLEIKDGDAVKLGDVTLRFILTPMVHWPETMMTYVEEKRVLFTGDAFGCFGALNGGVVDSQMDTDMYFPEMYRYYSNIVGKYGVPVQKAIAKTKDLKIDYICPTHGPVWHEKIGEVVGIYDRLSQYKGEDGVTIVYGSMYGNTEEIAEAIASRLSENGIKTIKVHNVSKSDLSFIISDAFRYRGLIVGGPTYSMKLFPPVAEFMAAMEIREIKNKVIATFGSFTWSSNACSKLNECAANMKLEPVATVDLKQSPKAADFEAAIQLADALASALHS